MASDEAPTGGDVEAQGRSHIGKVSDQYRAPEGRVFQRPVCWCGSEVGFRADKGFHDCLADRTHDWRGKDLPREAGADVEALAALIASAMSDPHLPPEQAIYPWGSHARRVADWLLASDWLAAHVQAARAEAHAQGVAQARAIIAAARAQARADERERITRIPDSEPTGWTTEQWRANASYWYERAQEAYRYRDAAALRADHPTAPGVTP